VLDTETGGGLGVEDRRIVRMDAVVHGRGDRVTGCLALRLPSFVRLQEQRHMKADRCEHWKGIDTFDDPKFYQSLKVSSRTPTFGIEVGRVAHAGAATRLEHPDHSHLGSGKRRYPFNTSLGELHAKPF